MTRRLMMGLCLPATLLLAACISPAPDEAPASVRPDGRSRISSQEGLPTAELQILDREGNALLEATVEIADRSQSRQVGLMDVETLPENTGMAFLWDSPHRGGFHMLNTLIPLEIAFWDQDMRIVGVEQMQPCETESPCPTYGPESDYIGAVELNEGELTEAGVEVGHTVALER